MRMVREELGETRKAIILGGRNVSLASVPCAMLAISAIFSQVIFSTECWSCPGRLRSGSPAGAAHSSRGMERDHSVRQKGPQEGDTLLQGGRNQEKWGSRLHGVACAKYRTLEKKKRLKPTNTINSTALILGSHSLADFPREKALKAWSVGEYTLSLWFFKQPYLIYKD